MLYHLLYPLSSEFSVLNVFRYITFRSAYAAVTALIFSLFLGPWVIERLRKSSFRESIRGEGPTSHRAKAGTPTMGGVMILAAVVGSTLLWADLTNRSILLVLLVTVILGAVGFLDDYLKNVRKMQKGLIARYKLIAQVALGLLVGCVLYYWPEIPALRDATTIPFFRSDTLLLRLSLLYVPFVTFVITGSSNAVNLTDGLDGLAIGLVAIAAAGMGAFAYLSGHVTFAGYLGINYIPSAGELTVFCAALLGASLGFLYYNCHPADVFMGDTGSLPLGGALGVLAVLLKRELIWAVLGGVFFVETLSVIIQVSYFKRTGGKRFFRMAPIHHHFEQLGWAENRVVVRFWLAGILLLLVALSTLKVQ